MTQFSRAFEDIFVGKWSVFGSELFIGTVHTWLDLIAYFTKRV